MLNVQIQITNPVPYQSSVLLVLTVKPQNRKSCIIRRGFSKLLRGLYINVLQMSREQANRK